MYFEKLPEPPIQMGATQVVKRLVDGLGFRYYLSTKDITGSQAAFRPVATAMSIAEVNQHIFQLIAKSAKALGLDEKDEIDLSSFEIVTKSVLGKLETLSKGLGRMTDEALSKKTVCFNEGDTHFSFWYLINGFLADALIHVGQLDSWRSMAGNPVSHRSAFTGEPISMPQLETQQHEVLFGQDPWSVAHSALGAGPGSNNHPPRNPPTGDTIPAWLEEVRMAGTEYFSYMVSEAELHKEMPGSVWEGLGTIGATNVGGPFFRIKDPTDPETGSV